MDEHRENNGQFGFTVVHRSRVSRARCGVIRTAHGTIETPCFVAVGTNATLKVVDSSIVNGLGLQLMFCNTYHLMLQPGTEVIRAAGGLHSFINRPAPIITDSGGFQVFSLAYGGVKAELKSKGAQKNDSSVLRIDEEGVLFRSYRNGDKILLTPESSVRAQKDLGADIIIPLDELPPYHIDGHRLKESLDRTHRWQKRSLDVHRADRRHQAMYAVIHGGLDRELRAASCHYLTALDFDGWAIGGSLGENHTQMFELLDYVVPRLPAEQPNHLLGIGDFYSMRECITRGIDTFDSSHPTRSARHGLLFTSTGTIKILNSANRTALRPADESCTCACCTTASLAYLHHLFKAKEMAGLVLATVHNLSFMITTTRRYRQMIMNDEL